MSVKVLGRDRLGRTMISRKPLLPAPPAHKTANRQSAHLDQSPGQQTLTSEQSELTDKEGNSEKLSN